MEYENGSVMCSCNHLTHFAILLSPDADEVFYVTRNTLNVFITIGYISTSLDPQNTSGGVDSNRTSACVYLTGVPVGYYCDICTTKVRITCIKPIFELIYFIQNRSLWNMRNYIHCMLCANLITAQLVFVVGVERTENEVRSVLLSSH